MSALTLYFCGTGQAYDPGTDKSHLLGTLKRMTHDGPREIFDGVGSEIKRRENKGKIVGQKNDNGAAKFVAGFRGNLLGFGAEVVERQAMELIERSVDQGVRTINLCGFSRGAVQCMMTASRIGGRRWRSPLTVNIFSIDPVTGPNGITQEVLRNIPKCVDKFEIIVMEHDDKGSLFSVAIPGEFEHKSKRKLFQLPGDHGHAADQEFKNIEQQRTRNPVAFLVLYLARKFLKEAGSFSCPIDVLDNASTLTLVDTYAYAKSYQVRRNWEQHTPLKYRGVAEAGIAAGSFALDTLAAAPLGAAFGAPVVAAAARTVVNPRNHHAHQDQGGLFSPYVNWHHKSLFEQEFPLVAHLLERHGVIDTAKHADARSAIADLRRKSEKSFTVLRDMAMVIDGDTATVKEKATAGAQKAGQAVKKASDAVSGAAKKVADAVKKGASKLPKPPWAK